MSDEAYVKVGKDSVRSMRLRIPQSGRWTAEIVMSAAPAVASTVDVTVGGVLLRGTVVESMAGSYAGTTGLRLVGGHGGWSERLAAKHYHNDGAGVRALAVAQDAARECGEQLGTFTPVAERLGIDYVRTANVPACKALEDAAGGNAWWVELDGTTTVGVRPTQQIDAALCPTLAYDPLNRVATLGLERLDAVRIGSVITQYVDAPQTVHEIMITVAADEPLRARVWCGGGDTNNNGSRLAGLLRTLVTRTTDKPLSALYRYRVVSMVGDRVECESARRDLPNVRPISMWPGVPGCFGELKAGAEVLIAFINGDPTEPVIVAFAPHASPGFVPESLVIGAKQTSTSKAAAARVGDEVTLPTGEFSGEIGGSPATGTITFASKGIISSGSDIVEVG